MQADDLLAKWILSPAIKLLKVLDAAQELFLVARKPTPFNQERHLLVYGIVPLKHPQDTIHIPSLHSQQDRPSRFRIRSRQNCSIHIPLQHKFFQHTAHTKMNQTLNECWPQSLSTTYYLFKLLNPNECQKPLGVVSSKVCEATKYPVLSTTKLGSRIPG